MALSVLPTASPSRTHASSLIRGRVLLALAALALGAGGAVGAAPPEVQGVSLPTADTLGWETAAGAVGYHVYRGFAADLASNSGECSQGSVKGTTVTVNEIPVPGRAFTYLVTALDENGVGSLGNSSGGDPRQTAGECTPSRRIFPPQPNGTDFDGVESGFLAARGGKVIVRGWDPESKKTQAGVIAATGEFMAYNTDLEIQGRG